MPIPKKEDTTWLSPKANGAGDYIEKTPRTTLPINHRKCTTQTEDLKLKLKKVLKDGRCPLKKSLSIAEITPTKSKVKKRLKNDGGGESTLHATPRPTMGGLASQLQPSGAGRCVRERAVCTVYQRLLLCVWRRSKVRLASVYESCRRQQDQISQLQMQIEVLRNLRQSECVKRDEAIRECQQVKKEYEILKEENLNLEEDLMNIEKDLRDTEIDLQISRTDLKLVEMKSKKLEEELCGKIETELLLNEKVKVKENEFLELKTTIKRLEESLENTETNLKNVETLYESKQEECIDLYRQLETKDLLNFNLEEQLTTLEESRSELIDIIDKIRKELKECEKGCSDVKNENVKLHVDVCCLRRELAGEKQRTWLKETVELGWKSLHNLAYFLLPVYGRL